MSDLGVADLIKRFREGKPTSRQERIEVRRNQKMWWEADSPAATNRMSIESLDQASLGPTQPSPGRQPRREEFRMFNQPESYLDEPSPPRSRAPVAIDRSFDLDTMIEKEIRLLQRDLQSQERDTVRRINTGNFGAASSVMRTSGGLGDGRLLGSSMGKVLPATGAGDTLGSTGLLGLAMEELKLDGKDVQEEKPSAPSTDMEAINQNLEALLKNLMENAPSDTPSYLPEGVEETIPQVASKIDHDLIQLRAFHDGIVAAEAKEDQERKERDERMREEGRMEERTKRLLEGLDHLPVLEPRAPVYTFREDIQQRAVMPPLQALQHAVNNGLLTIEEAATKLQDMRNQHTSMSRMRLIEGIYNGSIDTDRVIRRDGNVDKEYLDDIFSGEARLEDLNSEDYYPSRSSPSTFPSTVPPVHKCILSTAKAIEMNLNAAMEALAQRLPEKTAATPLSSLMAIRRSTAASAAPGATPAPSATAATAPSTSTAEASAPAPPSSSSSSAPPAAAAPSSVASRLAALKAGGAAKPADEEKAKESLSKSIDSAVEGVGKADPAATPPAVSASLPTSLSAALASSVPTPTSATPAAVSAASTTPSQGSDSPAKSASKIQMLLRARSGSISGAAATLAGTSNSAAPATTTAASAASSSGAAPSSSTAATGTAAAPAATPSAPLSAAAPPSSSSSATGTGGSGQATSLLPSTATLTAPPPSSAAAVSSSSTSSAAAPPHAAVTAADANRKVYLNDPDVPTESFRLPSVLAGFRKRGYISPLSFKSDLDFVDAVLAGTDSVDKPSSAALGNSALRRDHFTQFLPSTDAASLGFQMSGLRSRTAPAKFEIPSRKPRELLSNVRSQPVVYSEASVSQFPHDLGFISTSMAEHIPAHPFAPSAPPLGLEMSSRVAATSIERTPATGAATRQMYSEAGIVAPRTVATYSSFARPAMTDYVSVHGDSMRDDIERKRMQLKQLRLQRQQLGAWVG